MCALGSILNMLCRKKRKEMKNYLDSWYSIGNLETHVQDGRVLTVVKKMGLFAIFSESQPYNKEVICIIVLFIIQ